MKQNRRKTKSGVKKRSPEQRITKRGRAAFAGALGLALALMMCSVSAFAAVSGDTPDPGSYAVQQAAGENGNTATVTLGKILTTSQPGKFPNITDFAFTIEPKGGWDNANVSTELSGNVIAAADMPGPAASNTAHHSVSYAGKVATVLVGDFQSTADQTHSTGDGADSSTRRTRATDVRITFTKAGYYVYEVKEAGSIAAGAQSAAPVKTAAGVDYDNNWYYMVFYVCNKVDSAGNTTDGVYVHSITSYANEAGTDHKPTLSDIRGVTDNGGNAAGANEGRVEKEGNVKHTLGKVGVSQPTSPNRLEAYRMWSAYTSGDLVLGKNVTGNLGDKSKNFVFTITLSGLGSKVTYTTNEETNTAVSSTKGIVSVTKGTMGTGGTSFTSDSDGKAEMVVNLRDNDYFVINGLPCSCQYTVSEAASDHVAKYTVTSAQSGSGTTNVPVIASASGTNGNTANKALSTALETVDRYDGTVTVTFTNNRDLAAITGVPGTDHAVYALIGFLLAAAAAAMIRGRRRYAEEDVFEG